MYSACRLIFSLHTLVCLLSYHTETEEDLLPAISASPRAASINTSYPEAVWTGTTSLAPRAGEQAGSPADVLLPPAEDLSTQ